MNIDRLRLMVTMLQEVRQGNWKGNTPISEVGNPIFDLESWLTTSNDGCGFAACAIGHAMIDPRFNALGLVTTNIHYPRPSYDNLVDWDAIANFFELRYFEPMYLLFTHYKYHEDLKGNELVEQVERRALLLIHLGEEKFLKIFSDLFDEGIEPESVILNEDLSYTLAGDIS